MGLLSKLFGKDDDPRRPEPAGEGIGDGPSASEWAAQVSSHYGSRHERGPGSKPDEEEQAGDTPADAGDRPADPGDRPADPGDRPADPGDRPADPGDRPADAAWPAPAPAAPAPAVGQPEAPQPEAPQPEPPAPAVGQPDAPQPEPAAAQPEPAAAQPEPPAPGAQPEAAPPVLESRRSRASTRAARTEPTGAVGLPTELESLLAHLEPTSYRSPDGAPVPGMTAILETVSRHLGPPWKVTGPGLVASWRGPGGELRCGLGHEGGAWHAGHGFISDADLAAEESALRAPQEESAWRQAPTPWALQPPGTYRPPDAWWPTPFPPASADELLAQLTATVPSLLQSMTVMPTGWGVRRQALHHELGSIRVDLVLDAANAVEIHWSDGSQPGERRFETPSPDELSEACTAIVEFLGSSGADWGGLRTWCGGDGTLTTVSAGSAPA